MKIFSTRYLLIGIIFLAAILRFWGLSGNPPSLYWDEVSQGYNTYSILKTARDEHGEFLPLARFKAFGDYKAPVYIYADVPFMALFGKSEFAIRFPSAFFGTLTVLVTFLLAREIFFKEKKKEMYALFAAFFLSISPWHIQLSRAAYEGNIATFFTVASVALFFYAKRKNPIFFIFSAVCFVLAFYAFNAHRVFIPLLVALLGIIYFKEILRCKKQILIAGIIGLILLSPFLAYFRTPESKLRFNEVNIFSDLEVIKKSNDRIEASGNALISRVFDNRRVNFAMSYAHHYFDFFNPTYLFFTGDENPRFSLQENGILYIWELPLLLIGFYLLLVRRDRNSLFILGWFILAPIAAATARETPHALRSETFIPTYQLIGSVGAVAVFSMVKKIKLKYIYPAFILFFFFVVVFYKIVFLHNYFVHFPHTYSGVWQYGYKEAVQSVEKIKNDYDVIAFTKSYGRPHIYVAMYGNVEPEEYWRDAEVIRDPFGFYEVPKLGKYEFRQNLIDNTNDKGKKILYVGARGEVPDNYRKIDEIKFINGETAFVLATN